MSEFHKLGDKTGRIYAVSDDASYDKLVKSFGVMKITEYPKKYPAVVFVSEHGKKSNSPYVRVDIIGVNTLISDLKKVNFIKSKEALTVNQETKSIQDRVIKSINDVLGLKLTDAVINDPLEKHADFDSLDMIEITMELENEFSIEIDDEPLTDKGQDVTITDIINHVQTLVSKSTH